ncbi:hypothetical protein [Oribacterium sp.]
MERKTGEKGLMLGHFVLLLLECIVVLHGLQDDGLGTFRFYTTDSNLLCGISSAFMLFFLLQRKNQEGKGVLSKALQGKGESWAFPPSLSLFRYIASVCLALTFFVVLLVLGPENGFAHEFLDGTRFFSHLLCPFLSIFLFLFMEEKRVLPVSAIGKALGVTLLYAIPLLILNGIGLVSGPYSFLKIREQSLGKTIFWIIAILLGNALLALALQKGKNLFSDNKKLLTR